MRVLRDVQNRQFEVALAFVQDHYASLFHPQLVELRFVRAHAMVYYGLHTRNVNDTSDIKIRNGRQTTAQFVETLVHELCHLQQYVTKRALLIGGMSADEMEHEAEMCGTLAKLDYIRIIEEEAA